MMKKLTHCAPVPVPRYNGPLGGTQQILRILLYLIFIYLIIIISVAHCTHMAKLKIIVPQGKFISVFAVILVKHCKDKQWQQY